MFFYELVKDVFIKIAMNRLQNYPEK